MFMQLTLDAELFNRYRPVLRSTPNGGIGYRSGVVRSDETSSWCSSVSDWRLGIQCDRLQPAGRQVWSEMLTGWKGRPRRYLHPELRQEPPLQANHDRRGRRCDR